VRSIAKTLQISHSTVLKHLNDNLHLQSFYLCWMPHLLTLQLREQWCRYAKEVILFVRAEPRDADIISSQEMSRGPFYLILSAERGSSPEMTSLQSRGPIFTQTIHVYSHMESTRIPCYQ
jgi:hypothetical protein